MTFSDIHKQYNWQEITDSIGQKTAHEVERVLQSPSGSLEDFKTLISPAAEGYLEEMATLSQALTLKRFGKTIQLYLPLYLSNACTNSCVYCGFNHQNKIERITLSEEQVMNEIAVIKQMGYQHILLVAGEDHKKCGYHYLSNIIDKIKQHFSLVSIEVAPLEQNEYTTLVKKGLHTVYVYQETYHAEHYKNYHPKGKKTDFTYRIETPDRLGKAGIHKIGLGCLLGLEDWRTDSFFTALHLRYLEKHYWTTKYSISFPRLRPHTGAFQPNFTVSDKNLLQLICAYRIFNEDVEISLSTREKPLFRDNMVQLGITSMSAGSKTEPGGYAMQNDSLEQFAVSDNRSAEEIATMIRNKGYEPLWKDWNNFTPQY